MAIITPKLFFVSKCVLLNEENKFLILKRTDYKKDGTCGLWDIPGGSVDEGEDVNFAIKREFQEELGVKVGETQVFHVDSLNIENKGYNIFTIFYANNFKGEIKLSEEHDEMKWISLEEIENYEFYLKENRIKAIKELLKRI